MNINPTQITNFNRSIKELQAFWIFCITVAGRNSDWAARTVAKLLNKVEPDQTPFEYFKELGEGGLHNALVANKVGQYTRIHKAIKQSLYLLLNSANLSELMDVHGVGPKTARFFLLHSRENCQHAVLDTHILRWLADHHVPAPSTTPQKEEEYCKLEKIWLKLSEAYYPNTSPAQRDLLVWAKMSGREL